MDNTQIQPTPPQPTQPSEPEDAQKSGLSKVKNLANNFSLWYRSNKKISVPLSLLAVVLIIFAVPWSRYHAAGLVLKKDYIIQLTDNQSNSPISGANVSVDKISVKTDGSGRASLRLPVGSHSFVISKKYYQDGWARLTVPILSEKKIPTIRLTATGRQVGVSVVNLITKEPLANVNITVSGTDSKTNKTGQAIIVVPANLTKAKATLALAGYNDAVVTLNISDNKIIENKAALTPAGKVYFLSKLSGTVDVVKTNLDGSDRQTVLAGTGKEDSNNTVLLASRDWKYLALLSKRAGNSDALYLIDTSADKLTTIDDTAGTYTLVGWSGDNFVYEISRTGYNNWQPNATSIKSYNALSARSLTLVNSSATGTSNADAQYENIWEIKLMGDDVVYTKTWYQYPGYLQVPGKQDVLAAIRSDGTNSRTVKSVDAGTSYVTNLVLAKPNQLYFDVNNNSGGSQSYLLDASGKTSTVNSVPSIDATRTYLLSPSADQTFWAENRDGKNTLLIGDQSGNSGVQIASLSDYTPYGWYSDKYLLVSKNASELYAMDKTGKQPAVKISDYHKPSVGYYGYGGGYGGL